MLLNRFFLVGLTVLLLAACQSGSTYKPPQVSLTPGAIAIGAYLRANVAAKSADYAGAAAAYLDAVSVKTNDVPLRRKAMDYSIAAGDMDTALRLARTIKPEDEPGSMAYLLQMVAATKAGEQADAEKFMKRALRTAPDMMHFQLLDAYLHADDTEALNEHRQELADMNVSSILAARLQYHLGRLAWLADEKGEAYTKWKASYSIEPGALFTVLHYGRLLEHSGEIAEARKAYNTFLDRHGNTLLLHHVMQRLEAEQTPPPIMSTNLATHINETLFGLGMLLWAQDLPLAAQQALQVALYAEETPYVRFYLGLLNEHAGRHQVALQHFQQVPLTGPAGLAAHMRMGENYRQQGKITQATQLYQNLLVTYPKVPAIYDQLARLAQDQDNYRQAITYYTQILNLTKATTEDTRFQTLYARGAAYERLNMLDKAAQDMQAALKLQPNNPDVLNYLGYMWLDEGQNIDQAFTMVKKALEQKPNSGAILDSVGWGYYQKGDYQKALRYIRHAHNILPDDPTIIEHLGDIQAKLGNKQKARRYWEQAWEIGPVGVREKRRLKNKLGIW